MALMERPLLQLSEEYIEFGNHENGVISEAYALRLRDHMQEVLRALSCLAQDIADATEDPDDDLFDQSADEAIYALLRLKSVARRACKMSMRSTSERRHVEE